MFQGALYTIVLLSLSLFCTAQGPATEWTTLTSSNKDFEISLPADYLVIDDNASVEIISSGPFGRFEIITGKHPKPHKFVKESRFGSEGRKSKEKLAIKDLVGWRMDYEVEEVFSTEVRIASPTSYYIISAMSDTKDQPVVAKFLSSIRCAGKQLTAGAIAVVSTSSKTFDDLKVSPEVVAALDRNSDLVAKGRYGTVEKPPKRNFIDYSRDLIVLRSPRPFNPGRVKWAGSHYTVRAKVEFRKDGRIGWIIVDPTLDKDLATNIGQAAAQIKFIPAQQNGVPVDVTRVISYSFYGY